MNLFDVWKRNIPKNKMLLNLLTKLSWLRYFQSFNQNVMLGVGNLSKKQFYFLFFDPMDNFKLNESL